MNTGFFRRLAAGSGALVLALCLTACNKEREGASSSPNTAQATGSESASAAATTTASSASATVPDASATTTPSRDGSLPSEGWVSENGVWIRRGPGTDYLTEAAAYQGDKVTILSKEGDWYQIQLFGVTGYMNAAYIVFSDPGVDQPAGSGAGTTAAGTGGTVVNQD